MTSVREALLWPSLLTYRGWSSYSGMECGGYTASQNWASQTNDDVFMLTAGGREVGHNYSSDYNYDDLWTKSWKGFYNKVLMSPNKV